MKRPTAIERKHPTTAELRAALRYDPETGKLYWRHILNGREAFTTVTTGGYHQGTVFGYRTSAHRVIWAMHHGEWPEQIDHISGKKTDNRLGNLRAATAADNQRNKPVQKNSKTGVSGVSFDTTTRMWKAIIYVSGRQIWLGRFGTFEAAVKARKEAEKEHGFHPNHGRAAHG